MCWMLVGVYCVVTGLYLRVAWDIRLIPAIAASPLAQLLFYPAITLRDVGMAPINREWLLGWFGNGPTVALQSARPLICLGGFAAGAAASLWVLLKIKAHIFETSLATKTPVGEKPVPIEKRRRLPLPRPAKLFSSPLPPRT